MNKRTAQSRFFNLRVLLLCAAACSIVIPGADGMVVESWHIEDWLSFLFQVGAMK
jgi:hypothetical protein